MQLRSKITMLLGAAIAVSLVSNYVIQRISLEPSFRSLEHVDAIEDWERCRNAITLRAESLSMLCFDWASWDDAYGFVQGKNPSFAETNLKNPEWFSDQNIDLLYFCKPDGEVFWRHVAKLDSGDEASLAWMPADRLPAGHPLLAVKPEKSSRVDGFVRTELGLMMISACPILTSNNEGPLAGVLIFGQRITDESIAKMQREIGVQFQVKDAVSPSLTIEQRNGIAASLETKAPVEQLIDSDRLAVRGTINDLSNEPIMLVEMAGERHISNQGNHSLNFATWSLVTTGLLTMGALLLAMRWLVVRPLCALTQYANHVGESGYKIGQMDLKRSDEIGALARAFEGMLDQLDMFRTKSVSASRQAGMAEVAAGVLHNVGNALTNVNVLADTLSTKLASSKVSSLTKVSVLLNEHQSDLPGFFSPGAQGQHLPAYLTQLASHLGGEITEAQQDLTELRDGLQHIKEIVVSHKNIATDSNFLEPTDPGDLVAKTLVLVEASLRKHGVTVMTEGKSPLHVACDRSKLSQVLLNLLTNAKESLLSAGVVEPRVTVRLGLEGAQTVFIEVSDNGPGISPERRERLFSRGFTTKESGRGIGLHYCWLAIREMNGTLRLAADGESRGATFRIELPAAIGTGRLAA